jgi:pilus assembly protein CpaF
MLNAPVVSVPPWQTQGGVSTLDHGQFADAVAAQRRDLILTKAQIDAVIDEIVRAREAGADLVCVDPTAPPEVRLPAFSAIMRPAIARGAIPDLQLSDMRTLQALYDAALGWGPRVQPLLDDGDVTEVKINGTTALAASSRGLVVVPDAYSSVEEPQSRVRALAQMLGVLWDATHPSVTLPLAHKTRLHATRAPLVPDDDLLIVIRRGHTRPWSIPDLVTRGALSDEAADLLLTLIRARLSLIVSGAQDSGKTTFLECALNALPPHEHVVLVEDNTDEFCLRSQMVTRLRVGSATGASAFGMVVRETLRMTPSVMAPGEIRGEEAGAIAQIAEAGRPTMTTIHARGAEAALWRFARLAASDTAGNSFARQPEAALRVIAESFQLIVHMVTSQRMRRRIVREVALLDGLDATGMPRLLPLITTMLEDSIDGGVRWDCHAELQNGELVWRDRQGVTPARVAALLADAVIGADAPSVSATTTDAQIADLLARARELLPYADQAGQTAQYLEQALALAPHQREPWSLAERLLANHIPIQASTGATVTAATQQLQVALASRDIETIRKAVDTTPAPLLVQVALAHDVTWQTARAAGIALLTMVDDVSAALAEANSYAQHDTPRALRLLERFVARELPWDVARQLLEARIALLQAQVRDAGSSAAGAINHQLGMAYQQLATLDAARAAPMDDPLAAVPDARSVQVAPPSVSRADDSGQAADLSRLVGHTVEGTATLSTERRADHLETELERQRAPDVPALDVEDMAGQLASVDAPAIDTTIVDSAANDQVVSLPFRIDSAAEVGDWKRILHAAIARPIPEESDETNST